jgi:hypothetical protein
MSLPLRLVSRIETVCGREPSAQEASSWAEITTGKPESVKLQLAGLVQGGKEGSLLVGLQSRRYDGNTSHAG